MINPIEQKIEELWRVARPTEIISAEDILDIKHAIKLAIQFGQELKAEEVREITEKDIFRGYYEGDSFHFSIKRLARDVKIQKYVEMLETIELLPTNNNTN